jgi:hypothetical protein
MGIPTGAIAPSSPQDDEPEMSYEDLVSRYVLKHNRSPPQRFQDWFKYAKENKCYLDRYDSIYRDLAPFMGLTSTEYQHRLDLAQKAPLVSIAKVVNGKTSNGHYLVDKVRVFFVF